MKIIISKEFFIIFFESNGIDKVRYVSSIVNLLKQNYRFYISANTCLEITRLLSPEQRRLFHSRIEILCEEILPLTFEVEKQISEFDGIKTDHSIERATAIIYGIDLILKGNLDMVYSMSNLKVVDIGLEG